MSIAFLVSVGRYDMRASSWVPRVARMSQAAGGFAPLRQGTRYDPFSAGIRLGLIAYRVPVEW